MYLHCNYSVNILYLQYTYIVFTVYLQGLHCTFTVEFGCRSYQGIFAVLSHPSTMLFTPHMRKGFIYLRVALHSQPHHFLKPPLRDPSPQRSEMSSHGLTGYGAVKVTSHPVVRLCSPKFVQVVPVQSNDVVQLHFLPP